MSVALLHPSLLDPVPSEPSTRSCRFTGLGLAAFFLAGYRRKGKGFLRESSFLLFQVFLDLHDVESINIPHFPFCLSLGKLLCGQQAKKHLHTIF
jgi:hypothetical protein